VLLSAAPFRDFRRSCPYGHRAILARKQVLPLRKGPRRLLAFALACALGSTVLLCLLVKPWRAAVLGVLVDALEEFRGLGAFLSSALLSSSVLLSYGGLCGGIREGALCI
jgi:hypothetical protein